MKVAVVLCFLMNGVKLHFLQFGYHLRGKYAGVQRDTIPWLWVSNRGASIPVGTRFSAGKSSVLYLCFRLTRERGLRRSLHDSRVWQQTLFRGSRTVGFCDVGYGTNAGFLRSKIRLAGEGSRGIYSPHPAAAPRTKTTTAAPAIGCPSQYLPTSLRGFPAD